jgi:hypothetical protein
VSVRPGLSAALCERQTTPERDTKEGQKQWNIQATTTAAATATATVAARKKLPRNNSWSRTWTSSSSSLRWDAVTHSRPIWRRWPPHDHDQDRPWNRGRGHRLCSRQGRWSPNGNCIGWLHPDLPRQRIAIGRKPWSHPESLCRDSGGFGAETGNRGAGNRNTRCNGSRQLVRCNQWADGKRLDAHVAKTLASKPKLVQISAAYGQPAAGSTAIPRNKYIEIKQEKPQSNKQRDWPEYKTCKSTTEAIITEGTEKGELRKICADPNCPVHHPKKQKPTTDANWKAEQEKQRREEALAQATGLRVLNAIIAAVPVRLMKRDLLFIVERVATILDERRLEVVARNRGIKKAKDSDSIPKLLSVYIRRADEGELGRLLVEMVILHATRTQPDGGKVLKEAAQYYKVDTDAITLKVKQEFTAKQKAQAAKKVNPKTQPKPAKKSTAA